MQLLNTDILRAARNGQEPEVWIAQSLLVAKCPGIKDHVFKLGRQRYRAQFSLTQPDTEPLPDVPGKHWRYWINGGRYYYALDSIPAQYRAKLPDEATSNVLEASIEQALRSGGRGFASLYEGWPKADRLARAAAVSMAIATCVNAHQINPSKSTFWQEATHLIQRHDIQYLPSNPRVLQRKIMPLIQGTAHITDIISLPRAGNQNAKKIEDPIITAWVYALMAKPETYPGSHIVRVVKALCAMSNLKAPSSNWLEKQVYSNEAKYLTADTRFGSKGREATKYKGYVPIATAPFASDAWFMDATRVNMIPVRERNEKTGQIEERSVFMVAVTDAHSLDTLAMTFTYSENRYAYLTLLANAYRTAGHLPYEIVTDRFPGHNTPEGNNMIERLRANGCHVTISHEATAKSKQERWWRTLQSLCFQHSPYYYGEGIQSKGSAAHRSAEHKTSIIKSAKAEGWTYNDLANEVTRLLGLWRNTPLHHWGDQYRHCEQSPAQMFAQSAKPNAITLSPERFAELFGHETTLTMARNGQLLCTLDGVEMHYRCDESEVIRRREGTPVVLCFDIENPSTAYIFEPDPARAYRRYIGEVRLQNPVHRYGPNADGKALGKAQNRIKRLQAERAQALQTIIAPVADAELAASLHQLNGKTAHEAANETLLLEELAIMTQALKPRNPETRNPKPETINIYDHL